MLFRFAVGLLVLLFLGLLEVAQIISAFQFVDAVLHGTACLDRNRVAELVRTRKTEKADVKHDMLAVLEVDSLEDAGLLFIKLADLCDVYLSVVIHCMMFVFVVIVPR